MGAKETAPHAAGYDPLKLVFEKLVQYVVDEARASRGLKTSEETRAFPVCPREQRFSCASDFDGFLAREL